MSSPALDLLQESVRVSLAVFGGIGAIVTTLTAWLSKLWASRILESEKQEHANLRAQQGQEWKRELMKVEAVLSTAKAALLRYSEQQFERYLNLWDMLCELKESLDALNRNRAAFDDVKQFMDRLAAARLSLSKGALLIEQVHEDNISEILYEFLKQAAQLGDLRRPTNTLDADASETKADEILGEVVRTQDKYWAALNALKRDMRRHIRGEPIDA